MRRSLALLSLLLLGTVVLATTSGAFVIAPGEVLGVIAHRLLGIGATPDALAASVVLDVRLPRVLLAASVGAALALAGSALQGVLGNPLAEPGVLGLSAAAALGAVGVLALVGPAAPLVVVLAGATLATGAALALLVRLARHDGRTETLTLVLAGIAVQAAGVAALAAAITALADPGLRTVAFWSFGSAGAADPASVLAVAAVLVLAGAVLWRAAPRLDLLALGERTAAHLGVSVAPTRRAVLVAVALLTAAAVSTVGVVAFVGLIVPHAMRRLTGPAHSLLLPASALGGAMLLVLTDLASRTLFIPRELPLGTLTALVGAPLFLLLLRAARERQGGWV